MRFVSKLEKGYKPRDEVPFHNRSHAADVVHGTAYFLNQVRVRARLRVRLRVRVRARGSYPSNPNPNPNPEPEPRTRSARRCSRSICSRST